MTIGDEKVVAWMTPGGDVSRSFDWCDERCMPPAEPIPLILQSAYAELAAERDDLAFKLSFSDKCYAHMLVEAQKELARADAAESQLAELRGRLAAKCEEWHGSGRYLHSQIMRDCVAELRALAAADGGAQIAPELNIDTPTVANGELQ